MLKRLLLTSAALPAMLIALVPLAHAVPTLYLETIVNGGTPIVQTPVTGNAIVQALTGGGNVDINIGTSTTIPSLDLDVTGSTLASAGAFTLQVILSETGLSSPVGLTNWKSQFGGNFSGGVTNISTQYYVDNSDNPYLTSGTLIGSLGTTSTPFSGSASSTATATAPYALTIVTTISGSGLTAFSDDNSITNVPEPITLSLLGTGLVGLGLVRRRRGTGLLAA